MATLSPCAMERVRCIGVRRAPSPMLGVLHTRAPRAAWRPMATVNISRSSSSSSSSNCRMCPLLSARRVKVAANGSGSSSHVTPWPGSGAIGPSRRPASLHMQVSQMARQMPALCPPSMPRTFSPRLIVSVAASDRRDAGFANGRIDAVLRQLDQLNEETKDLATQLKNARTDMLKKPGDQDLRGLVQDLKKEKADLDKRRKALEAMLLAAGGGSGAAGDDRRLYSGVTLYVLSPGQQGYSTMKKQHITRNQLQGIWDKSGYIYVARVDTKPAQLLTIDTCPDFTDLGSMDLEDGMQLAVVVHQSPALMDLLQTKVTETTDLVQELQGVQDNIVDEQENAAAAWALEQIKAEPGAQIFRIKEVAKAVELDGAACSDVSAAIVERKQIFKYSDLEEYVTKLKRLKKLIELGAANTELLQGKKLRAYAMADSWSGSTDEQAAMVLLMNKHDIEPVMPDGSAYSISWGCNSHRPGAASSTAETEACAQRFS